MATHYTTMLSINQLRLSVNLGEHEGERKKAQPVDVDIHIFFPELPPACHDDGNGFLCYDKLSTEIIQFVAGKEFRLIEFLTMEIYAVVKAHITRAMGEAVGKDSRIKLKIHKCIPPVPHILNGTSFTYTDLPEGLHAGNA